MHQIYSCSDENIEVFTTVIPSKGELIIVTIVLGVPFCGTLCGEVTRCCRTLVLGTLGPEVCWLLRFDGI